MMRVNLVFEDITRMRTDAIVNAANPELTPGGGVCGAIHAAAGPELARACAQWVRHRGPVAPGSSAITPGFGLPARFVIHTVGPVWRGGTAREAELLGEAYRSAMFLAEEHALTSIAFPSISTGIYGYPLSQAAPIALRSVTDALEHARSLREVTFAFVEAETYAAYTRALGDDDA